MQCLQIPQFGAFYPPPQKEGSTPQEKKRKRHFYADGRRAVLPKLPCLLPDNGTAASWEAPELEDSKEADGSSAIASGAPTLMTLQQAERPANAPAALTDKSPLAETGSTKAPQLPPKLPQFNTAGVQPQSQHAGLQQQEGLAQGSQASSMSGVSEAAAKGSFQPQAAPQQVPFGQQLIPGTAASAPSIQQSQIPVLGTPSNATTTEAGGFAGVPAQPTVLPFQPVQPSAVPGQQPGLLFGQLTHQVPSLPCKKYAGTVCKLVLSVCVGGLAMALQHSVWKGKYVHAQGLVWWPLGTWLDIVCASTTGRWHGERGGSPSASACSTAGQEGLAQMKISGAAMRAAAFTMAGTKLHQADAPTVEGADQSTEPKHVYRGMLPELFKSALCHNSCITLSKTSFPSHSKQEHVGIGILLVHKMERGRIVYT